MVDSSAPANPVQYVLSSSTVIVSGHTGKYASSDFTHCYQNWVSEAFILSIQKSIPHTRV